MKKVLIITYYWPPSGGAGVQRWLKFSKYLPENGWEPLVLTVDPQKASYAQWDKTLEKEVSEHVKVYTTTTFELYNLYRLLIGKGEIPYGGFSNQQNDSIMQKLAKFVRGNFFIPDPRRGWNRYAYKKAKQLIEKYNIQTVITTSPPHSTQLIGLKLQRKLGIQWIADLRDPWTDIYYYRELGHTPIAKQIDRNLERKVLNEADQVVTVSEDLKRLFSEKLKQGDCSKILVIPNGFDVEDFKFDEITADDKFVITYTGTISEAYDIDGFLKAVSGLDPQLQSRIRLRFVGNIPESTVLRIQEQLPLVDLDLVGYVDHQKSVRYLLMSSMQLLVIPKIENNKGIITGKFYEYLASEKPVLAIGPKGGDLESLIHETQCGELFDYGDTSNIRKMIEEELNSPRKTDRSLGLIYSRKELAKKLVHEVIV
ncbi:glycosyltransferase family 4 protein [Sunxiuqinia elliptica]|uniref:Glycosyltransferase involved in cell wall biosynthesis n=1 Tax=Sunxiuqinia elliptica TaxID=655355 RepID=A0A4V3BYU0_9BACT|nr:glycosyltransferase family 4 protein [Sunxiuqinia elliptica]TDO03889.1 glycosyltransferase involved in cell wall biosynthesis [Sunxiuqinia elliptica]TDO62171.1 glycosyltransferase involved in cell wall biosynthesis [Sunxiuqinia elliptica]